MNSNTNIIIGDSRGMDELKDESVHLVITSPPYWQLKDYGNGNQIGFNMRWRTIKRGSIHAIQTIRS